MEQENPIQLQNAYRASNTDWIPFQSHADMTKHIFVIGYVIPNRIFVGRIDHRVYLSELRQLFSKHGLVREVKIVTDRVGMSKGYGFVTFEYSEDVLRILNSERDIYLRGKKLTIGYAIQKDPKSAPFLNYFQAFADPSRPQQRTLEPLHLPPYTSCLFTHQNDAAYLHCPNMSCPADHWPPSVPHMVYQPPAYQPFQYQWDARHLPLPPAMYPQQSEYQYLPADGVLVPHVMENITAEDLCRMQSNPHCTLPYQPRAPHIL